MEIKKIWSKEDGRHKIEVFENTFKGNSKNWSVVQTNTFTEVEFGRDIFDTKRKLNNFIKIWK